MDDTEIPSKETLKNDLLILRALCEHRGLDLKLSELAKKARKTMLKTAKSLRELCLEYEKSDGIMV